MNYKKYPKSNKTYIVIHTTGFIVQGGSDYEEHHIVYESNSYEDAVKEGKRLYPSDPSGWTYNSFVIYCNISTKEGKKLYKEFKESVNKKIKFAEEHPELYDKYESDGIIFHLQKNELFNYPVSNNMENYRLTFINIGNDNT